MSTLGKQPFSSPYPPLVTAWDKANLDQYQVNGQRITLSHVYGSQSSYPFSIPTLIDFVWDATNAYWLPVNPPIVRGDVAPAPSTGVTTGGTTIAATNLYLPARGWWKMGYESRKFRHFQAAQDVTVTAYNPDTAESLAVGLQTHAQMFTHYGGTPVIPHNWTNLNTGYVFAQIKMASTNEASFDHDWFCLTAVPMALEHPFA